MESNRMPKGIPYIIANEFAERFCFYGINAILSVYLVRYMHFGDAQATVWQSLFKSGAYFFPLVGAVVSDVFWGKFRTIITFSIAYTRWRRPRPSGWPRASGSWPSAPVASSPACRPTSAISSPARTST